MQALIRSLHDPLFPGWGPIQQPVNETPTVSRVLNEVAPYFQKRLTHDDGGSGLILRPPIARNTGLRLR